MIKHTAEKIRFSLFALALLMLSSGFDNRAFADPPADVLNYYLKLPGKYFDGAAGTRTARMKCVKISDARNGYLRIEKPYKLQNLSDLPADERGVVAMENRAVRLTSPLEIALFKHEQGRNIVAVSYRWSGDCPACATPRIDFWQDENGVLKDVTETVLATVDKKMLLAAARRAQFGKAAAATTNAEDENEILKGDLVFKLPRAGRTIKILTDAESTGASVKLIDLRWTGSGFVSEAIRRRGLPPKPNQSRSARRRAFNRLSIKPGLPNAIIDGNRNFRVLERVPRAVERGIRN